MTAVEFDLLVALVKEAGKIVKMKICIYRFFFNELAVLSGMMSELTDGRVIGILLHDIYKFVTKHGEELSEFKRDESYSRIRLRTRKRY